MSVEISPATRTSPVVTSVSHATRLFGSSASIASRTASEIWSASLSGCPSVTDSEEKRYRLDMPAEDTPRSFTPRAEKLRDTIADRGRKFLFRPRAQHLVVAIARKDQRVIRRRGESGSLSPHLVHDDEVEVLGLELAASRGFKLLRLGREP